MSYLTSQEIRERYLKFFEKKGHKIVGSASLIPDDPTMLLTIAGMVPFKPYFLGKKTAPTPRMASSQKCIRTNDLENVGKTARHHTFFEMLGNFAFGDYFKEEAIIMAWEFITKELEISPERLWITVYEEDDESVELWHHKAGVDRSRIVKMGKADNFWEVGPTGSCGPCSEIHVDRGEQYRCGPTCEIGCSCDRFLEIWNLVFTEYNQLEDGTLEPLPKKNIDTGMGLERITSVMQEVDSNFETDLFVPIIQMIEHIIKESKERSYEKRVIADHIRAATFMISDGILPSNEGRGYILRKLIRRASTFARRLNFHDAFLARLVDVVIQIMGEHYQDLHTNRDYIKLIMSKEEERFQKTLDQGLAMLTESLGAVKAGEKLSGEIAFKLYDTYGFPYDLTVEIAMESGVVVDEKGYHHFLEKQRENSRNTRDVVMEQVEEEFIGELLRKHGKSNFIGYHELVGSGKVIHLRNREENIYEVIFDTTPFYAESGGQVADSGTIQGESFFGNVLAVSKMQDLFIHTVEVIEGSFQLNTSYQLMVDPLRRAKITANHTAAHLLHAQLMKYLGKQAHQAGSHVDEHRMRFDFSYFQPVNRSLLRQIEEDVNQIIWQNSKLKKSEMSMQEAEAQGALAFFEDKYQEVVRVVEIPNHSVELCGGTHVDSMGELGMFKIISETGISAGVRRIEAITGAEVFKRYLAMDDELELISEKLKTNRQRVVEKIDKTLEESHQLQRELQEVKSILSGQELKGLAEKLETVGNLKMCTLYKTNVDIKEVKSFVEKASELFESCFFVAYVHNEESDAVLVVTSKKMPADISLNAKSVLEIIKECGFKGGGKPNSIQAGGPSQNISQTIFKQVRTMLESQ